MPKLSLPRVGRLASPGLCLVLLSCSAAPAGPGDAEPWFREAATEAGLTFAHAADRSSELLYPEVIPPGVALFDADGDGDLDVLLLQSGSPAPGDGTAAAGTGGRLFRNDVASGPDGSPVPRFTDVTRDSGVAFDDYAMGVAAGDVDNDGCVDLYVTALRQGRLLRNDCAGTFEDVTVSSGTASPGWSVSAAFLDFDRDGWLDLFVGHYLAWSPALGTPCFGSSGRRVYCAPEVYRAEQSRLYRNNRDGTFADVTDAAGLATTFGPALGASTADFDGDGWIDLYVANDGAENQLWLNQRDGTFVDHGLLSGTALGPFGRPKAGMGVDAGDLDDDGDEDLVVTNLAGEGHDLYVNDGTATFVSAAAEAGIGSRSLPYTGFGAGWLDVDNDGWLDVLTVNGSIQLPDSPSGRSEADVLGQSQQLFRNLGTGRFDDVTSMGGPALEGRDASRGAAFGDVDNDGDVDVVVANNEGPVQLLLNAIGSRQHWVGLRLLGPHGTDSLGARVAVTPTGGRTRWRRARSDGSYGSASDPRVLVGLGGEDRPVEVRVHWPDGRVERWTSVEVDRYTTLSAGTGEAP
jgi:hypothetical protein